MRGRESRPAHIPPQPSPGAGVLFSTKWNVMDASFGAKDVRCGHFPVLLGPLILAQRQRLAVFSASVPWSLSTALYCRLNPQLRT